MLGNFDRSFDLMIQHEGGFVNDPDDPGGATNLGITQRTLSNWLGRPASINEVKALTKEKVKPIYKKNYWDVIEGDLLPLGVDYITFDSAVNSGPYRAAWWLQRALVIRADGDVGNDTVNAAREQDEAITIARMAEDRMDFLRGLKTWWKFGKGWTTRVDGVEDMALKMAREPPPAPPPPVLTLEERILRIERHLGLVT